MKGRGGKPRMGLKTGYNTGSGNISILSKDFNVSGTVRASTITASTINCIDTVLNTSNNLYVENSELYLNGNPIGLSIAPYELTVSTLAVKQYDAYLSNTTFVVPTGVNTIEAQIWGGGGGYYGNGSYIHIQAQVAPGDVYEVVVGTGGNASITQSGAINTNGMGGGGNSAATYLGGASGGSYSAIIKSELASTILVIAGAGGAASYSVITGSYSHAGITAGYPGGDEDTSGKAGSQTAGGQGGVTTSGDGVSGNPGASYSNAPITSSDGGESIVGNGGGGGGGGYYSGGGGAGNSSEKLYFGGGGGGGSSYINTTVSTILALDGTQANIYVLEEQYQEGVGLGGTYDGTDGAIGPATSGGPGLVVISYYNIQDLYLTSPYIQGRFIAENIQAISTITNNLTFNTQKPMRIYANNNDKYIFEAVGSNQSFLVPSGVNNLNVKLWGAAGFGLGPAYGMGNGGYGGYVAGSLPVTPGDILTIIVGSQGGNYTSGSGGLGGFGGGGNGALGGGGRTAIQIDDVDVVTAGGGGGASLGNIYSDGGAGGNYTGQPGILYNGFTSVGQGGTQTAGGLGGGSVLGDEFTSNYQGMSSFNYIGGDGAFCNPIDSFSTISGGGGGGGYYGGGGGGGYFLPNDITQNIGPGVAGAGGGGSSFLSNLVNSVGIPGNYYTKYIADPDYIPGAGLINGLVVISYPTDLQIQYTDPLAQIAINQTQQPRNGWVAGCYGLENYGLQWSFDGLEWNTTNNGGFPYDTRGIAFNQSNWVAVGMLSELTTGSVSSIQTSSNGIDWIQATSGGFSNGYGVIWGKDIWVAVGEQEPDTGGSIQVSKDGMNWSNTSNSFPTIGYGIAYNTITRMYIAVGQNNYSNSYTILYSKNAINWNVSLTGGFTEVTETPIYNTYYSGSNGLGIATNNLGSLQQVWVAVGSYPTNDGTIQYSIDGSNWSNAVTGGFVGFGRGVAYGNGLWVAVGDSTILSQNPLETIQWSRDGSNWSNAASGGFGYSGNSVAFNGKLWVATGYDLDSGGFIQNSVDGSNWEPASFVRGNDGPACIAQGILNVSQNNYTFLTNSEVITQTLTTNYATLSNLTANYINSGSAIIDSAQLNYATVSNLTANYGNIGDIYSYSQVLNIIFIEDTFNIAYAIGNSATDTGSIETSITNSNWDGILVGGFSPIVTYSKTRITSASLPKAILYNHDSTTVIAYGLTNEAIYSNNFLGTVQVGYASNSGSWSNYTGTNSINTFILQNLNNALYANSNYFLLTSIAESPILVSKTMGEFYIGATQNAITYSNFHSVDPPSTLSEAYGFYSDGTKTYVVGTANSSYTANGNSPVFFTEDGSNFFMPYGESAAIIQANMPPTFYGITNDTQNNILFMVGPGIQNGNTSLSTCMYSVDAGINWSDAGLEGVISARAVSWGSNPTAQSNTVVIACEATSSSNTIITYTYTDLPSFTPYVGNTLTSSIISLIYSADSGSNFISSATYGFDAAGYGVTYDGTSAPPAWYAVGANIPDIRGTVLTSPDGSNWSALNLNGYNPINIAGYGVLKVTKLGVNLLYVVGESSYSNNTVCFGSIDSGFYSGLSVVNGCFDSVGYGIAYNGTDLIVAVGSGQVSGTILYTTDGGTLSNNVTGAFSTDGYGVAYGNGLWIAVGRSSTTANILYSANGSNWSNGNYGFDIQGQGVVYRDVPQSTLWVAVGKGIEASNILYSSDGSNWFNANTATFSNIGYGVTWDGLNNFVAVGDSGTLTSPDGSNWYSINSGDFNSQSTIVGTGNIILSDSAGYSVASDGAGNIVAVGAASNTNRQYNWLNINPQNIGSGSFDGFSSMLSEDGITIQPTYLATSVIYNPIRGGFVVGGLTNDTKTCIVSDSTSGLNDLNIWSISGRTSFNATNELQFINSCNRTVVAKDVTTNLLHASNAYISESLFVSTNTNTYNLNATNVNSLNITSGNIYSSNINTNSLSSINLFTNNILSSSINVSTLLSINTNSENINSSNMLVYNLSTSYLLGSNIFSDFVSTNNLNVNQLIADYTTTNYLYSSTIITSTISVDTITFTNNVGNYASIETIQSINTRASFFHGDATNLSNVTANNLEDKGGAGYNIPNTNIIASNITGNFTGSFTGTVSITGPLSDDIINTNVLNASSITTYGNITMIGTNGIPGIITGDGSGLTNVIASTLLTNVNQSIGSGNFSANTFTATTQAGAGFTGNGSGLTNLNYATSAGTAAFATTAGSLTTPLTTINHASNATNASNANTATYATSAGSATTATSAATAISATYAQGSSNATFIALNDITSYGALRIYSNPTTCTAYIGSNITALGNIQGNTITATGGFVGDGSRLTGINSGGGGGGGPYKVLQGNVRNNGGIHTFSACIIPKGLQVYSILKVIVAARPNSGPGSYHIAEVMLKGAEERSLIFLNETITGADFSGETPRSPGDNAFTVPSRGIYFVSDGTNYTLMYNGNAADYIYGMYGVIQQQV